MTIIISEKGGKARRVEKTEIERENYLQEYVHSTPEVFPVYEIEEDKKLLVVAREFPTDSGPIDALAIDGSGDIYIVETKLYKNPDKRTVVAQALDYGASLWKHVGDFGEFVGLIDKEVRRKFKVGFEEKTKDFFQLAGEEYQALLDSMRSNLQNGNLKFVVLMDDLEERLKDLIVFINQSSQFDLYAVKLQYYRHEQQEIVIPKLFGVEVKEEPGDGT